MAATLSVYACIAVPAALLSLLTCPLSPVALLRCCIAAFLLLRTNTTAALWLLSLQLLISLTDPADLLPATVLFWVTPKLVDYDVQKLCNAAAVQLLIASSSLLWEHCESAGATLSLYGLLALLGYYAGLVDRSASTLDKVLADSRMEIKSLHSVISVTSDRLCRSKTDLRRMEVQSFSSISYKLKHLASPPVPCRDSLSFSDYVEMATPGSQESIKLTLGSEEGKNSSFSDRIDLSAEEFDTLKTALLSKEYLIYGAKRHKSTPIHGEFLQMLIQKTRISLTNHGPAFKGRNRARLRSMMEENEELSELFEHLGEWNFDMFDLLSHTDFPLREVGFFIYTALSCTQRFKLERSNLMQFLDRVEQGYKADNYYHNSLHAADVVNSVYFLLYSGIHRCGNFLELEVFALVTAALAHDVGHPGFNNAFLVQSQDPLAKVYNDHSVLENMHSATLFSILKTKQSDITQALKREDYLVFRKLAIALILATDLQRHFDKQAEFKGALEAGTSLDDVEFRQMTLEICLKCADIGHGAKELRLHKQWSCLITKEFFRQGEMERKLGLTVSPICNKELVVVSKSQIGFIEVFVKPLFDMWTELVRRTVGEDEEEPEIEECPRRIAENLEFWARELEAFQRGQPTFVLDDSPSLQVMKLLHKWP